MIKHGDRIVPTRSPRRRERKWTCINLLRPVGRPTKTGRRSSRRGLRQLRALRRNDLFEDRVQATRNFPTRIVALDFSKIRYVTNVVALSRFVHVAPIQLASGHLLDALDNHAKS